MIELEHILTEELTDMRVQARIDRDFTLSDLIRNELDKRGCFCIDGANGQIVYHMGKGYTRPSFMATIRDIDLDFKANFIRMPHRL